jgi:hypothetical protein
MADPIQAKLPIWRQSARNWELTASGTPQRAVILSAAKDLRLFLGIQPAITSESATMLPPPEVSIYFLQSALANCCSGLLLPLGRRMRKANQEPNKAATIETASFTCQYGSAQCARKMPTQPK